MNETTELIALVLKVIKIAFFITTGKTLQAQERGIIPIPYLLLTERVMYSLFTRENPSPRASILLSLLELKCLSIP